MKYRTLNLRAAEVENTGCAPTIYSNRVVIPFLGHRHDDGHYHQFTDRVYLHVEWSDLPWMMRYVWAAWWQHKKQVLSALAWQEKELLGGGVEKPKELQS